MKIFYEHDVDDVCKVGIKCFPAQEAEMSLMALLVAMGEIKICYERDKHDVYKVGIKVFRAQEGEMSLIAFYCSNRRNQNFS